MSDDFLMQSLEQSLIEFLLKRKNIEELVPGGARRVKSLSIKIDAKNPKHMVFAVQIGMMEAKFNMADGLKEQGSCYGLDRNIRDWYEQPSVKFDFDQILDEMAKKS